MREKLKDATLKTLRWLAKLRWREFVDWCADTASKIGIGGAVIGIFRHETWAVAPSAIILIACAIFILLLPKK